MRSHVKPSVFGALAAGLALVLGACGGSASTSGQHGAGANAAVDGAAARLVPAAYKSDGVLTIATDASYAPNEFFSSDGKTIVGMDVDLGKAIVAAMGLKVDVVNASFDSILPGLASGKYDLGISSFTDTKEREQTVTFVTYFTAGTSFFVRASEQVHITGLSSLCGLSVAVEKGTTQAVDATDQSAKCTAAGKQPVTVEIFPDQGGANLALTSGRADVAMADSPLADYQVKQSKGTLKLVGSPYGTAPYGIAMAKDSHLARAVLAAVRHVQSDGEYHKILAKWGLTGGALQHPAINAAKS